ncbi:uncharacterized protein [Lepisosteus oculatus]|uniref:uncharacterized protein n=1 Tax=Lepisosteus oculatus TaxID=7918 RepID=UPI0035F52117
MMLWAVFTGIFFNGVCSDPVSVSVRFGGSVSLPCDGSAYRGTSEDHLFFLWQTEDRRVCEYNNGKVYTGPGFENRAEVSRETIRRGNFSLTLHHASFSDEDIYKCSYEHERDRLKFLGSVHLIITAHSEVLTLLSGDSLTLPLHTAAPVEVLFDPAGSAQSPRVLLSSAGLPGPGYEQRVWVQDGSLTLRSLTPADQGSYTVRDLQGNTISTAIVTVEARRDNVTLQAGASLSVPLFTGDPVEVLFDPAGGGNWTSVCSVQSSTASCVPQYRDRVSVDNQELRLQELRASDQGSYTVRDLQGNTISALIVSVEAPRTRSRVVSAVATGLAGTCVLAVVAVIWGKRGRLGGSGPYRAAPEGPAPGEEREDETLTGPPHQHCPTAWPDHRGAPLRVGVQGDPAIPDGHPAVPSEDPAIPSGYPAVPSEDPAIPNGHPAVPSEDPAIPSGYPAVPSEDPAIPSGDPTS